MRRRDFIALLGGGAFAPIILAPLATRAQNTSKLPAIGFLGTPSASAWTPWTAAFIERLRELGWVDGRTVTIEFRWVEGRADRFTEIATEFARQGGRHRDVRNRGAGDREGHVDHPDRVRAGERSARHRHGGKPGAAGRQRDRTFLAVPRSCRQAAGTVARRGAGRASVGCVGECQLSGGALGNG